MGKATSKSIRVIGPAATAAGETSAALGSQAHGPYGEARPVGEAQEGDTPETETIQDVIHPEGVSVAFGGITSVPAGTGGHEA